MKNQTDKAGIPAADVRSFHPPTPSFPQPLPTRRRPARLSLVLLMTFLLVSMSLTHPPQDPAESAEAEETLPTAAQIRQSGLQPGDSITLCVAPISFSTAPTLLAELETRGVHVVFVLTEKQYRENPSLANEMELAGHRVKILPEESGRVSLPYDIQSSDVRAGTLMDQLFDGCTVQCPVREPDEMDRLLLIADTVRYNGVRVLLSENIGYDLDRPAFLS